MKINEERFWKWLAIIVALFIAGGGGVLLHPLIFPQFKQDGFDSLKTVYELNDTTWMGHYIEINEDGMPEKNAGYITFNQEGSRILGSGYSSGYEWLIEGIIYKGLLCYIYVGSDPNSTSIGVTTLQLDDSGNVLNGQWSGWTPDGEKLEPQQITLTRQK